MGISIGFAAVALAAAQISAQAVDTTAAPIADPTTAPDTDITTVGVSNDPTATTQKQKKNKKCKKGQFRETKGGECVDMPQCAEGEILFKRKCVVKAICTDAQKYNRMKNECIDKPNCTEGQKLIRGKCIDIPTCEDGEQLIKNKCVNLSDILDKMAQPCENLGPEREKVGGRCPFTVAELTKKCEEDGTKELVEFKKRKPNAKKPKVGKHVCMPKCADGEERFGKKRMCGTCDGDKEAVMVRDIRLCKKACEEGETRAKNGKCQSAEEAEQSKKNKGKGKKNKGKKNKGGKKNNKRNNKNKK